jgi:hypothetical protein
MQVLLFLGPEMVETRPDPEKYRIGFFFFQARILLGQLLKQNGRRNSNQKQVRLEFP